MSINKSGQPVSTSSAGLARSVRDVPQPATGGPSKSMPTTNYLTRPQTETSAEKRPLLSRLLLVVNDLHVLGTGVVQWKQIRHWSLIQMLCWPTRSPLGTSGRLPGGTRRASYVVAA